MRKLIENEGEGENIQLYVVHCIGFSLKKSKQNIIPTIVPFNYASNTQKDESSQKSKHVCVCYDLERECVWYL